MVEVIRMYELETPAHCPGYIHSIWLPQGWVYHEFFLKLRASGKTASRTAIERVKLIVDGYVVLDLDRAICDDMAKLHGKFKRAPRSLVVVPADIELGARVQSASLEIETAKECRITVSGSRSPWIDYKLQAVKRAIARQPFF